MHVGNGGEVLSVNDWQDPGRQALLVAMGWVCLFLVLVSHASLSGHPETEIALVLGTLAGAEAASSLLVGGLLAAPQNWQDCLERMLVRWTFVVIIFLGAFFSNKLPFFDVDPFAGIVFLALSLCLVLLRISAAACYMKFGRHSVFFTSRLFCLAGAVFLLSQVAELSADLILALALFLALGLLIMQAGILRIALESSGRRNPSPAKEFVAFAPILLRRVDLIAVFLLFPPSAALVYICARGGAALVGLVLDHLQFRAVQGLADAGKNNFVAMAARINLGCLLIGGGAALLVLVGFPVAFEILSLGSLDFRELLNLLLLGQCGPIIFGATTVLLQSTKMRRARTVISLLGTGVFTLLLTLQPYPSTVSVAEAVVVSQLGTAGLAAALLALRTGIWPGITAILFRRIKLF